MRSCIYVYVYTRAYTNTAIDNSDILCRSYIDTDKILDFDFKIIRKIEYSDIHAKSICVEIFKSFNIIQFICKSLF